LILKVNKRLAYDVTHVVRSLAILGCFSGGAMYAQDTISLAGVEVSAEKTELSQIGKKTVPVDSTAKEQFKYNSVADLLSYNSSVFIKSYGPGGIATTAFRGGNASQTAVLWNGFNLQNAMLGQADLSLMPSVLFENMAIEYGGSSSLWGSGAVTGSIHLNNETAFNRGLQSAVNFGAGSFGALNGSAAVLVSKSRFLSSTKLYMNSAKNNFKYIDTLDKESPYKRHKDSEYNFKGLMQEFKYMINSKQIFSLNAWLNDNQRHLPIYNSVVESKTYQRDAAMRLSANWTYLATQFKSILRGGYFIDKIDYDDSISSLFSKSNVKTTMLENENYFDLHKNCQLNLAVNFLSSAATTGNYSSRKSISRASVLIGNKFSFLKERLISYASVRGEYFSVGALPVTGNISIEYKVLKDLGAKINVARVYRQPTLNELYWLPGGNIHLKPEQGYTSEGELSYGKRSGNFTFFISGSVYNRMIKNWILWVPGANGNPTPLNIQEVWSRGAETSWKINYGKNKWRAGVSVITGYCLSTVQSNASQNDNSTGKQLMYTPRYSVNGNVSLGYAGANLVLYHQYSGYRFTTSDNLNWLPPYHVSSLRCNYKVGLHEIEVNLFMACNNIFNHNYTVMAGRPVPLRNYELGIGIKTKNVHRSKE